MSSVFKSIVKLFLNREKLQEPYNFINLKQTFVSKCYLFFMLIKHLL